MIVTWQQFLDYCKAHGLPARVTSEPKPKPDRIEDHKPPMDLIERANWEMYRQYCEREGINPDGSASPVLRQILKEQEQARQRIDAGEIP